MNNILFSTKMKKKYGLIVIVCLVAIIGCVFIGSDSVDVDLKISDMTIGDLFIWIMGPICFGIGGILAITFIFHPKLK